MREERVILKKLSGTGLDRWMMLSFKQQKLYCYESKKHSIIIISSDVHILF